MNLGSIRRPAGSRTKRKRVGRGQGSRQGKTCGRGQKGQGARSGGKNRPTLFEGGQFPLWQRLPRRGFTNARHTKRYQPLTLARVLDRVADDVIGLEQLVAAGLAGQGEHIKIVAGVETKRKVTLKVHRVTASVKQAVEAAGGTVETLHG